MRIRDPETGESFVVGEDEPYSPPPNGQPSPPESDWQSLLNAPDFTELLRPAQTAKAKHYSTMVKSGLKASMVAALNVGDYQDAATILTYGTSFANASGQLADENEWAAKAIDIICSPASAPLTFALTASVFVGQLVRNHEAAIKNLPETRRNMRLRKKAMADAKKAEPPRFTVRVFGRSWPVRFRTPKIGKVLAAFKAQTKDPEYLTASVFSDPKVLRALQKQGIILVPNEKQV